MKKLPYMCICMHIYLESEQYSFMKNSISGIDFDIVKKQIQSMYERGTQM